MTSNELLFVFIPRLILFFFFFAAPPPSLLLHRVFPNNLREFSRTHFLLPDVGLMEEEGGGKLRTVLGVRLTHSAGLRRSPRRLTPKEP